MKKKIAVFAGGWGDEYFREVVYGISEAAKKENVDTYAFVNFSIHGLDALLNEGEYNLFTLPELEDFDGLILLANSFNQDKEVEYFSEKLKHIKVPAVAVEYELKHAVSLVSDNYAGMYDLARHIVEDHGARNILYIGGPQDHLENLDRLKALCDVAGKNGFHIPERNIQYGDWSRESGMSVVSAWVEEFGFLPDAILCANDIMAMGACDQLERLNYNVPEDVAVTGFDCLRAGQEYQPTIASVGHEWEQMGNRAFSMLFRMMNGEEQNNEILPTCFVPAQSCGCSFEELQKNIIFGTRRKQVNVISGLDADAHFRHIYRAVDKIDHAEDLSEALSDLFVREHQMEGENFVMCLDPEFFRIEEGDFNLCLTGYNDRAEMIGTLVDGKPYPRMTRKRNEALYWLAKQTKKPMLYIVAPLLGDMKTYGFAVLTGSLRIACANQFYIWTRHTSQYLELVRRNLTISDLTRKLTKLSVTDVLTGVYNRAGCEQIAFPMLEEWRNRGGTGIIMLVDVDKMKVINDKYGHANGDLALRTVASVLKSGLPEDWIISRYGGDEFFIGGRVSGEEIDEEALRSSMEAHLEKEVKKRKITIPLTISIGIVKMLPEDTVEITEYLQMADDDMYDRKQAHHLEWERRM